MHGEQNEMGRLKAALIREYEDNPVSLVSCHNNQMIKALILVSDHPRLCQIYFESLMVYQDIT